MSATVQHHPQNQEFTTTKSGHSAELAYSVPAEGIMDFTHTFVDEALRGQGVGQQLAHAGLAYARQHQLRVRTSCSFMRQFVAAHAEYSSLLE
ncbi:GNAT family N-acetyltransferase [Hymenobacter rubripertinctus]|uniref:N-acetyltransferase n=1 Tax=Hymenobacter rubripertinctus TaxID=2029981 RepID=A0A418QZE4_9BACT|nr:GNAT family N-acetyltransferase [Hymenobacter rubripertinctus]RIY10514.1 N-acetyltransferase [Hymenobacter rubripertinctus]